MFFYFLTIDRAESQSKTQPTKEMYNNVFKSLQNVHKFEYTNNKYPIECFEYKSKGSIKKKTKVYDWIHYHCIVKNKRKIVYNKILIPKYSIVWKPIYDLQTMAFYAGYCQKDKIDKVTINEANIRVINKRKIVKRDIRNYM